MPSLSAKNLGFIFDSTLSFSKQISSLSSTCHYHIYDLRCIRHIVDFTTATTIATSLINSSLDYCNSLYYRLPITWIKRLQHIQNGLSRAVIRTPKHFHITPVLKYLHWLKIELRIQYKIISIKAVNTRICHYPVPDLYYRFLPFTRIFYSYWRNSRKITTNAMYSYFLYHCLFCL